MNKTRHLISAVLLIIVAGCGSNGNVDYESPENEVPTESVNNGSIVPTDPASENISDGGEIIIPVGKGNPPSGILEQVSWFGGGGGLTQRDCTNCDVYVDDNLLIAYGFQPNQSLIVAFYRRITELDYCGFGTSEFVTTAQIQVDSTGSQTMPIGGSLSKVYVNTVVDAVTGQVIIPGWELEPECSIKSLTCSGAPPQRVEIGDRAYVCTQEDRLIVRAQPSMSGEILLRLETGTYFEVVGGPSCSQNMSWWNIEVDGMTGWVSEGGDNVDPYFICPAQ